LNSLLVQHKPCELPSSLVIKVKVQGQIFSLFIDSQNHVRYVQYVSHYHQWFFSYRNFFII